jgi:Fe-S cluster assembly ATP-binding protein
MLKITNLHVHVKEKQILNGINLTINPGEIHAIMGPNGSGKSTFSFTIIGNKDYKITNGSIFYNDKNIIYNTPEERSHLGIFLSFQNPVEIYGISMINFMKTAVNE